MNDTNTNPQPPNTPALSPPAPPPPPPIAFGPAGARRPRRCRRIPAPRAFSGSSRAWGTSTSASTSAPRSSSPSGSCFISLAAHSHGPFPGIAIPFWMVFSIIDATRQAKAINLTGRPESNILGSDEPVRVSGSLTAGLLLILIGGFLLLDRFVTIDLSFLNDWWPILLVAFGAWQVFRHYQGKRPPSGEGSVPQ